MCGYNASDAQLRCFNLSYYVQYRLDRFFTVFAEAVDSYRVMHHCPVTRLRLKLDCSVKASGKRCYQGICAEVLYRPLRAILKPYTLTDTTVQRSDHKT